MLACCLLVACCREQRRDHSSKLRQSYQSLESTLASLEQNAAALTAGKQKVIDEFEDMLTAVHQTFVKIGGDKLLTQTEDAIFGGPDPPPKVLVPVEDLASPSALASPTARGSTALGTPLFARPVTAVKDDDGPVRGLEMPSMFRDAAVIQSMKSGITVNNLPQVGGGHPRVHTHAHTCACTHMHTHNSHNTHNTHNTHAT